MLSIVVARVLQHDQRVVFLWCDHDFVLLGTNSNKLNVVLGVQRFESALSFCRELSNQRAVLNSVILTHGGTDGDAT